MKKISILLILGLFACGTPKQGEGLDTGQDVTFDTDSDTATVTDSDSVTDTVKDSATDINGVKWTRPDGYAVLTFCVDDTANKTYKGGQIRWTGSFAWDEKTNIITYATSWLPADGPFIPLYDDGPITKGGHEAEGSVAGDHKLCAEAYLKADKDYTIEYGTLDEYNHWIWQGPNGTIDIPKGSTKVYDLGTQKIAKFGNIDFKVALDMNALNEDFKSVTPDAYDVYVKTSANSWAPVQLLDNGKDGDVAAGDGVFTYQQSNHLGPHDGMITKGQHVQFVFVFLVQGMDISNGQEYKVGADCSMDGTAAWSDAAKSGDFQPVDVVMERDSRGATFNTTIIIGGGKPWCNKDADCFAGTCGSNGCTTGTSTLTVTGIQPAQGPADGGTDVTIAGTGFADGASVNFGDAAATDVAIVDAKTITCKTPAHEAGKVDVTVKNTDSKTAVLKQGFEYIEQAKPVTIKDAVLLDPLNVQTQQGVPTSKLNAKVKIENGDHQSIRAQCGFGPKDSDPTNNGQWQFIAATYSNDEAGYSIYNANLMVAIPGEYAFTFRFKGDGDWVYADSNGTTDGFDATKVGSLTIPQPVIKPEITAVVPNYGPVNAPTTVEIEGHNFKDGLSVTMGGQVVTVNSVAEDKIEIIATAHAMGLVDVSVKNPDGKQDELPQSFAYVPRGTPVIDGVIDTAGGSDWNPGWQVATNNIETDISGNELHKLYVAFDSDSLYIGIDGKSDGEHYIIGYMDVDYDAATGPTGYRDMTALTDNSGNGDLDDALSSTFIVNNTKFGADFGFGTLGMQSFHSGDDLGTSTSAGWRSLVMTDQWSPTVPPNNLYWLDSNVISGDSAVETSISLHKLWGPEAAMVPMLHHIALVVVISNNYGDKRVNQALPSKFDANNPMHLNTVDLWIRPENKD